MNSIYLRNIRKDLSCYKGNKLCILCNNKSNYNIKSLTFCSEKEANDYHFKYDIGAAINSIFYMLLLKETILDIDTIHIITKLLYQLRKRELFIPQCDYCRKNPKQCHFVNYKSASFCFCDKHCRQNFYNEYNMHVENYYISMRSSEELSEVYKW